jgi:hypothetical protein
MAVSIPEQRPVRQGDRPVRSYVGSSLLPLTNGGFGPHFKGDQHAYIHITVRRAGQRQELRQSLCVL